MTPPHDYAGTNAKQEYPVYPSPEFYNTMRNMPSTPDPTQYDLPQYASIHQNASPAEHDHQEGTTLSNIFWSIGSMIVSAIAWSFLGGMEFGIGIVLLILVHEMGHYFVIRAKGLPAKLPIFIPYLGAFVSMVKMPKNALDEAIIALAGPFTGGISAVIMLLLYYQTGYSLWINLAYFGFLINVLNLIPINPLDGGRVVGAISRWVWPIGLISVGYFLYLHYNPLLLIILVLGLFETYSNFVQARKDPFFAIPLAGRIGMTVAYVGLAIVLIIGTLDTQQLIRIMMTPL